jgi:PIN domain nuclease of toxin-antitoxin system
MLILDTHIWLRWLLPSQGGLKSKLKKLIEQEDKVAISAISIWELTMHHNRGQVVLPLQLDIWLVHALTHSGIEVLPIEQNIAKTAALLPEHHKDPADRIIIATAIYHQATLLSLDTKFPLYKEIRQQLIQ